MKWDVGGGMGFSGGWDVGEGMAYEGRGRGGNDNRVFMPQAAI